MSTPDKHILTSFPLKVSTAPSQVHVDSNLLVSSASNQLRMGRDATHACNLSQLHVQVTVCATHPPSFIRAAGYHGTSVNPVSIGSKSSPYSKNR